MTLETMSLVGGVNQYGYNRYKDGQAPFGRKVRFLNDNGYDSQREDANKFFKEGQVLTIKEIFVGGTSSSVEFVEFPKKQFNTVMFEDIV